MTEHEPAAGQPDPRLEQLRERLAAVRERIDSAVAAAGRAGSAAAADRGHQIPPRRGRPAARRARRHRRRGEPGPGSRGEGGRSSAALQLRWHFIGQLQSNKAKSVVKYAHAVHSVDRPQLAAALAKAMAAEQERTGRAPLDCFIQVSLDDDAGGHRGGALPADVPALAEQLAGSGGTPPRRRDGGRPLRRGSGPGLREARGLSGAAGRPVHPGATGISAGMSQDLEQAVRFGATHLRVGSDILGPRPALR